MKNLNRLFKEKPQTKKVDLSFCQLEEIDSLMAELYKFKQMEELNLSCNHIVKLPDDMSILKNLKKIDVTNNLFTNVEIC
jgi:Leucine-rich repeat (LRR) protein